MDAERFEARRQALVADRQSGAAALARAALALLHDSALAAPAEHPASLQELLVARGRCLAASRPSMTPVAVLPDQWAASVAALRAALPLTALRRLAAERAAQLHRDSTVAGQRAARRAAARLPAAGPLLTLSDSGTVRATLAVLAAQGARPAVVVAEARPGHEGRHLAAAARALDLPTTLVTDAQLGRVAPRCAAGLIGADTVLPDGSVVNKSGSHPLALALAAAQKPLYVVAESFKQRPAHLGPPAMEAMPGEELAPPPGVAAENVYFERVPAELIAGVITAGAGPS